MKRTQQDNGAVNPDRRGAVGHNPRTKERAMSNMDWVLKAVDVMINVSDSC